MLDAFTSTTSTGNPPSFDPPNKSSKMSLLQSNALAKQGHMSEAEITEARRTELGTDPEPPKRRRSGEVVEKGAADDADIAGSNFELGYSNNSVELPSDNELFTLNADCGLQNGQHPADKYSLWAQHMKRKLSLESEGLRGEEKLQKNEVSLYDELRLKFKHQSEFLKQKTQSLEQENQNLRDQNQNLRNQNQTLQDQNQTLQDQLATTLAAQYSAKNDGEFFSQSTTASSYTTAIRAGNPALLQRTEIAKSQAAQGVALVNATYEEHLRVVEEQAGTFSGIAKKDAVVDEEAPELRARCCELEREAGVSKTEAGRQKGEAVQLYPQCEDEWRREARMILESLEIEDDPLTHNGSGDAAASGPNSKVFLCEWRDDTNGLCGFYCKTRKELADHLITGGHILLK
ncbi:hypothetical protein F5877DRAFT_84999 [Lentinula edodes]|nr:hypothetical protein F5877DRAFT_84999 [Lentinula edodes]